MHSVASKVDQLVRSLPKDIVVDDPDVVTSYNTDWLGQFTGPEIENVTPSIVLRPTTTEQVSEIMKICHSQSLPVVPQGGNTGLVGGSVPRRGDEVVLSLSRLNNILEFDQVSGVLSCEAGCVLDTLGEYVGKYGYIMPLDLGSSGTCEIGGNISTNAGGIRLIRYGSLRSNVLGLKVVLADGTVLDLMNTLRKDNTGYDLKQLFIGSEGTLGIITAATIMTPPKPKSVNVALLGLSGFDKVIHTLMGAKSCLSEILSAVEFWDNSSMDLVVEQKVVPKNPLGQEFPFYMLIETSGSNHEHDMEKIEGFLSDFEYGVLSDSESRAKQLWEIRENITTALKSRGGHTYKYDVSIRTPLINAATEHVKQSLSGKFKDAQVFQYGHVGDGNLHLNVWNETFDDSLLEAIETSLYGFISEHNGSISAEHGIGVLKANKLASTKSPAVLKQMQGLKQLLDPTNILNPGKVLLQE